MVHALEIVHRWLKPDGRLIDIHPTGEPPLIEVCQESTATLVGHLQETDDFIEYAQASEALEQVVEKSLFKLECRETFWFATHAEDVSELVRYLSEEWSDGYLLPETIRKAGQLLKDANRGAELRLSEQVYLGNYAREPG
jgi:hypothetical protein